MYRVGLPPLTTSWFASLELFISCVCVGVVNLFNLFPFINFHRAKFMERYYLYLILWRTVLLSLHIVIENFAILVCDTYPENDSFLLNFPIMGSRSFWSMTWGFSGFLQCLWLRSHFTSDLANLYILFLSFG